MTSAIALQCLILLLTPQVMRTKNDKPKDKQCYSDLLKWSASFDKAHPGQLELVVNTTELARRCYLSDVEMVIDLFAKDGTVLATESVSVTSPGEQLFANMVYKRKGTYKQISAVRLAERKLLFVAHSTVAFKKVRLQPFSTEGSPHLEQSAAVIPSGL